jgi:glucosamine 6-phosphate synthetase-like amidotransferase/phosphosugar isomerase protein
MGASRRAGARTALVTVSRRSPGGAIADLVIETAEQDQSWCHTVGYLSPIVAAVSIAASLRDGGLDSAALTALLATGAARDEAASDVARQLTGCRRLLIAGAGIDLVTARELALKIEEGARLPATAMHLESIRHGHLAAAEGTTGLVFVLTDAEDDGAPLVERTGGTLRAASALGMPSAAILGTRLETAMPEELLSAGQLSAPEANGIWPMAERVIGGAPPMQLLALHLATALGRNPDPIGRDDARQAAAASA